MGLEYAHGLLSRFPPLAKERQGGFDGVGEFHHRKSPSVPLFQRGKRSLANNVPDTIDLPLEGKGIYTSLRSHEYSLSLEGAEPALSGLV
jgi:hypothetical protein